MGFSQIYRLTSRYRDVTLNDGYDTVQIRYRYVTLNDSYKIVIISTKNVSKLCVV